MRGAEPRIDVVCEGSPREMGLAQGTGLRGKIAGAQQVLRRLEAFRLKQPWWLPYSLFRRLAAHRARRALEEPLATHAPAMAERLAGMAEGAAMRLDALCLLNVLEAVMASVEGCTAAPPGGCSAVALRGSRSTSGVPVIAKNFDYLPLVQPFYVLRDSRPRNGLCSLEFTAAPLCGAIDGVNERGLCITYNYAFVTDAPGPAPTISMAITEALASCGTVAEAAEQIASRPRWGGGLLLLADAAGDIASLELSGTRSHLRRPNAGGDLLFHTNRFSSAAMREVEVASEAVFTAAAPPALRGQRVLESPELRDQRLAELLDQAGALDPDDLAALMADHGPTGEPSNNTVCMHGSYWHTTACLQLLPCTRRLRIAYAAACEAEYCEFAL